MAAKIAVLYGLPLCYSLTVEQVVGGRPTSV